MGTVSATGAQSTSWYPSDTPQRVVSQELDRNAFLKLLVTQLQSQDPLKPMEDREFIAELAQFSALEQMQHTNAGIQQLSTSMMMSAATSYIDRTVTVQTPGMDAPFKGVVSAVVVIDGYPLLQVGDQQIDPYWVTRVE